MSEKTCTCGSRPHQSSICSAEADAPITAGKQRKPPGSRTSESTIEAAIVQFLQQRGWIVDRNQVGLFYTSDGRPCPVGRRGQCDWRAVRARGRGRVEYLEVEVKRPGGKPSAPQREYMAIRTHQGIAVTWADSLEMFERWYRAHYNDEAVSR